MAEESSVSFGLASGSGLGLSSALLEGAFLVDLRTGSTGILAAAFEGHKVKVFARCQTLKKGRHCFATPRNESIDRKSTAKLNVRTLMFDEFCFL